MRLTRSARRVGVIVPVEEPLRLPMVERVYGRLPSDALAKLLSERVPRVEPCGAGRRFAAQCVVGRSHRERGGASELVRYLSGDPAKRGHRRTSLTK